MMIRVCWLQWFIRWWTKEINFQSMQLMVLHNIIFFYFVVLFVKQFKNDLQDFFLFATIQYKFVLCSIKLPTDRFYPLYWFKLLLFVDIEWKKMYYFCIKIDNNVHTFIFIDKLTLNVWRDERFLFWASEVNRNFWMNFSLCTTSAITKRFCVKNKLLYFYVCRN